MNQRQKKKQLKKIVDLMNQIEIDDYDGQGNELFYVLAEANEKHQAILEKICSITKANKLLVHMMYEYEGMMDDFEDWIVQFDLTDVWMLIKQWPKKYDMAYSSKKGFVIVRDRM